MTMLAKRIIPCLDIKNGRTVKGTNFIDLKDAGDPVELAKRYSDEGADELVFLDIAATLENRGRLYDLVEKVSEVINIPFAVGGGIHDVEVAWQLLRRGADKVSINSSAILRPNLINEISDAFGTQCLIVAADARKDGENLKIYTHGGTRPTGRNLMDWTIEAELRGAGEILYTSMDHDGTGKGFALESLKMLDEKLTIPVIASGGAGDIMHFVQLFKQTGIQAALAAGIFHFGKISLSELKNRLSGEGITVRV